MGGRDKSTSEDKGEHVIGTAVGPLGIAAGAAIGGIAGGLAGKAAGHAIDPGEQSVYWRNAFQMAPYFTPGYTYEDYGPAYELGYNGCGRYPGTFDSVEADLAEEWDTVKGKSRLLWVQAKGAVRAAWDRVDAAP